MLIPFLFFYALSYMSYQALECYVYYIIEDFLRGPGIYYIRAHRVAEVCKTRNMQVLGFRNLEFWVSFI